MNVRPPRHDIIVIGASAGGLDALRRLIGGLPASLPAAVFTVVHIGAYSHLAQILDHAGPLPVRQAVSGEPIRQGCIYVAPPGRHLLLHEDHILLRRGPRENMARPAIDPLFRSAACSFGARVIGTILSGALNDGTAGLLAVKQCGGLAVVQDPADAAVPQMPCSALRHMEVDHCVPVAAMAALLPRLAAMPAGKTPEIPLAVRLEAAIAAQEITGMDIDDQIGTPSRFTCPECHGTLWEIADHSMLRFRCHVGHAFSGEAVLSAQADEVERMLWALLRSHEERAGLAGRMAKQARARQQDALAAQLETRSQEYEQDAELVRRLLRDHESAANPELRGGPVAGILDAEEQG